VKKRPTRTEEALLRLEAIRRDASPGGAAEVRTALGSDRSVVVQRAAEVAAELGFDLSPELIAAFARVAASEDDRECMAADAVLKAMAKLGIRAPDTYLVALRTRRMVKVDNGYVDVAAPLRAHAAMALVETGYISALEEVAPMLADAEASVRTAAAEVLGVLGGSGAAAVLLLTLRTGDRDSDVLGACLEGLLRVDVDRYLPTVAKYLAADDARLVELAALALGETHSAAAFAPHSRRGRRCAPKRGGHGAPRTCAPPVRASYSSPARDRGTGCAHGCRHGHCCPCAAQARRERRCARTMSRRDARGAAIARGADREICRLIAV
jgi:hypothetical protein